MLRETGVKMQKQKRFHPLEIHFQTFLDNSILLVNNELIYQDTPNLMGPIIWSSANHFFIVLIYCSWFSYGCHYIA